MCACGVSLCSLKGRQEQELRMLRCPRCFSFLPSLFVFLQPLFDFPLTSLSVSAIIVHPSVSKLDEPTLPHRVPVLHRHLALVLEHLPVEGLAPGPSQALRSTGLHVGCHCNLLVVSLDGGTGDALELKQGAGGDHSVACCCSCGGSSGSGRGTGGGGGGRGGGSCGGHVRHLSLFDLHGDLHDRHGGVGGSEDDLASVDGPGGTPSRELQGGLHESLTGGGSLGPEEACAGDEGKELGSRHGPCSLVSENAPAGEEGPDECLSSLLSEHTGGHEGREVSGLVASEESQRHKGPRKVSLCSEDSHRKERRGLEGLSEDAHREIGEIGKSKVHRRSEEPCRDIGSVRGGISEESDGDELFRNAVGLSEDSGGKEGGSSGSALVSEESDRDEGSVGAVSSEHTHRGVPDRGDDESEGDELLFSLISEASEDADRHKGIRRGVSEHTDGKEFVDFLSTESSEGALRDEHRGAGSVLFISEDAVGGEGVHSGKASEDTSGRKEGGRVVGGSEETSGNEGNGLVATEQTTRDKGDGARIVSEKSTGDKGSGVIGSEQTSRNEGSRIVGSSEETSPWDEGSAVIGSEQSSRRDEDRRPVLLSEDTTTGNEHFGRVRSEQTSSGHKSEHTPTGKEGRPGRFVSEDATTGNEGGGAVATEDASSREEGAEGARIVGCGGLDGGGFRGGG
mmetsp:Transcript_15916/g.32282  ORF Transcript_15916/g.32282 Transcript_15916/m.32282 type:complete len:681 (+) Transcript_15916:1101-3143(+)